MILVAMNEGSLDRIVVSERIQWRVRREAFPGGGIELDEFDAAPEGTEGQPQLAVGILRDRRINGVEVIGATKLDDDSVIGPNIVKTE